MLSAVEIAQHTDMTPVWVAAITSIAGLIGIGVTAWVSLHNKRELSVATVERGQMRDTINKTYDTVNSVDSEIDHSSEKEPTLGQTVKAIRADQINVARNLVVANGKIEEVAVGLAETKAEIAPWAERFAELESGHEKIHSKLDTMKLASES